MLAPYVAQKLSKEGYMKLAAATMQIGGEMRRIEQREDGLWYLAYPEDQAELGSQGKPYLDWYKESDQEKFIKPSRFRSTMCYS
jgi:hypothetical protein